MDGGRCFGSGYHFGLSREGKGLVRAFLAKVKGLREVFPVVDRSKSRPFSGEKRKNRPNGKK